MESVCRMELENRRGQLDADWAEEASAELASSEEQLKADCRDLERQRRQWELQCVEEERRLDEQAEQLHARRMELESQRRGIEEQRRTKYAPQGTVSAQGRLHRRTGTPDVEPVPVGLAWMHTSMKVPCRTRATTFPKNPVERIRLAISFPRGRRSIPVMPMRRKHRRRLSRTWNRFTSTLRSFWPESAKPTAEPPSPCPSLPIGTRGGLERMDAQTVR